MNIYFNTRDKCTRHIFFFLLKLIIDNNGIRGSPVDTLKTIDQHKLKRGEHTRNGFKYYWVLISFTELANLVILLGVRF